jgi:hypothetical protein
LLARTRSVDDTVEAMTQLAAQDLTIMGDHARSIVQQTLSARVMSGKFQHIYDELTH